MRKELLSCQLCAASAAAGRWASVATRASQIAADTPVAATIAAPQGWGCGGVEERVAEIEAGAEIRLPFVARVAGGALDEAVVASMTCNELPLVHGGRYLSRAPASGAAAAGGAGGADAAAAHFPAAC